MLGSVKKLSAVLTIAALSAAMTACGSINEQSAASEPSDSIAYAHQVAAPSSETHDLSAVSSPGGPKQPESSATSGGDSGVGVSNAQTPEPATTDEGKAVQEAPFDSGHPLLNGIGFQDNVESVEQRFGPPDAKYELPGDHATIDMREYQGFA
ncbi:MAG: hypothetical protein J7559_07230, partial [Cohnella sp.]|nr:hypothetical protein [Cohnella sp.]